MNISKTKRSTQIAIMAGSGSTTEEKTASGTTPLTLSDSEAGRIRSIEIKGRSTVSAGSIVSVGNNGLTITTTDNATTSTAVITTGLPLRGLSSDICDVLDNTKVTSKTLLIKGSDVSWGITSIGGKTGFRSYLTNLPVKNGRTMLLCSTYTANNTVTSRNDLADGECTMYANTANNHHLYVRDDSFNGDSIAFEAAVANVEFLVELAEPVETSLTSAEVAAMTALKTYDSTTIISVTDNPSIIVKYMAKATVRTAPKKRTNRKKKS